METEPLRLPDASGVNTTVIEQLAPAASCIPQVVLCWKFPLAEIVAIWRVLVPELVSDTDRGWLDELKSSVPKVNPVGVKVTLGVEPTFIPPLGPPPQLTNRHIAQNESRKYFFMVFPSKPPKLCSRRGRTEYASLF
jgi:hypothetical protein